MPVRPKNADVRTSEYLTDDEVQRLTEAAKANRHGQRDATIILVAYRHGLRASELTDLRWDQVEFVLLVMVPPSQELEPPINPGRFITSSADAFVPFSVLTFGELRMA